MLWKPFHELMVPSFHNLYLNFLTAYICFFSFFGLNSFLLNRFICLCFLLSLFRFLENGALWLAYIIKLWAFLLCSVFFRIVVDVRISNTIVLIPLHLMWNERNERYGFFTFWLNSLVKIKKSWWVPSCLNIVKWKLFDLSFEDLLSPKISLLRLFVQ